MHHDSLKFYWTVASGSTRKAIQIASSPTEVQTAALADTQYNLTPEEIPAPEFACISYARRNPNPPPSPGTSWFLDSGGFSLQNKYEEYPDSARDYLEFVADHDDVIEKYALRDWVCERDLMDSLGTNVHAQQNRTIEDHHACYEAAYDLDVDADPVAVLQGQTAEDYLRQFDYYREHGLDTPHLGIGSLCRPNREREVQAIIKTVREYIPDSYTLHGFGVKLRVLSDPATAQALDTADSNAWKQAAMRRFRDGKRKTWDSVLKAYVDYYAKLEQVLDRVAEAPAGGRVVSLTEFTNSSMRGTVEYPLAKCVCGNLIDPNHLDLNTPQCRHCDQSLLTLQLRALDPTDRFTPGDADFQPAAVRNDPQKTTGPPHQNAERQTQQATLTTA